MEEMIVEIVKNGNGLHVLHATLNESVDLLVILEKKL